MHSWRAVLGSIHMQPTVTEVDGVPTQGHKLARSQKYISQGNSKYLLPCDSWVNNAFPNNLPHTSIVPVCWGGYEPSGSF